MRASDWRRFFFFIYSDEDLLLDLRQHPDFLEFEEKAWIQLIPLEDYQNFFMREAAKSLRFAGFLSSHILFSQGHPFLSELAIFLQELRSKGVEVLKKAVDATKAYYQSKTFTRRLKRIKNGMKPKVLVERSCASFAIKHFSDGAAKALKEMGCEVFMHAACDQQLHLDYPAPELYDIASFLPDLVLRMSNQISTYPSVPTVLNLHDPGPHYSFYEQLSSYPLNDLDLVYYSLKNFESHLDDCQLPQEQRQFFHHPVSSDFSLVEKEPTYDLSFMKNLFARDLFHRIYPNKLTEQLPSKEVEDIYRIDKKIKELVASGEVLDLKEVLYMQGAYSWSEQPVSLYHQRFCEKLLEDFLKERPCSLALYGKGWDSQPHFSAYAKGELKSQEAVAKS